MKVSELAEELEVPASTVLAQCQRFGIDASWAGAELGGADVVVLRAELASGAPIDLTPADPVAEPVAVAAGASPAAPRVTPAPPVAETPPAEAEAVAETDSEPASEPEAAAESAAPPAVAPTDLPPTAVGSMPEIADEITPDPEPEPVAGEARRPGGMPINPSTAAPDAVRTVAPRTPPAKRRFDRAARTSVVALVVAAAAYAASNSVDLPIFVALLWLVAGIALVVAVVDAFRGRRHAMTHPDRVRGAWLASFAMVFAVAGIVGLTVSVLAVTADDPAEAPVDLSDLSAVQVARWGYQRTSLLSEHGWKQPARDAGSCWSVEQRRKERAEDRVEATTYNSSDDCGTGHTMEVVKVFAYDRDADTAYPGADKILIAAQKQCADVFEKVLAKAPGAKTDVEYPTQVGWNDADHDVACTVTTADERTGTLAP